MTTRVSLRKDSMCDLLSKSDRGFLKRNAIQSGFRHE